MPAYRSVPSPRWSSREGSLVLRPRFRNVVHNYAQDLLGRGTVSFGVVVLIATQLSGHGSLWLALAAMVAAASAIVGVYLAGIRIVVESATVHVYQLFWKGWRSSADDLTAIWLREVRQADYFRGANAGGPTYKVLFVGSGDRVVRRMAGWGWSPSDLEQLGAWLGVPVDSDWYPILAGDLRRSHPTAVPWIEAVPVRRKAFVEVIATVALLIAAALTR